MMNKWKDTWNAVVPWLYVAALVLIVLGILIDFDLVVKLFNIAGFLVGLCGMWLILSYFLRELWLGIERRARWARYVGDSLRSLRWLMAAIEYVTIPKV